MTAELSKVSVMVVEARTQAAADLAEALSAGGCEVVSVPGAEEALAKAEQTYFDIVFLAAELGGEPSDEVLIRLVDMFPETLVLIMSDNPSVSDAVEFIRLGAFDYTSWPHQPEDVHQALGNALEFRRLRSEQTERRQSILGNYDVENIVGSSRPMQEVFRLIHKVAATDATVLVLGDSGTGKELVARAIHHHSPRRDAPLVPVNCGAIPSELLESELFGHEKGAFTGAIKSRIGRFEMAQGGTVFLDEIGDMSPMLQVKLLRVLQDHQFERVGGTRTIDVDIRVIAATNQDLMQRVAEGSFREDLFYRLNVVPIHVPPLRERKSDIPMLCDHFLMRLARQKGLETRRLAPEVMERFMRHAWPGNVRELENLLERMVILAETDVITVQDLPPHLAGPAGETPAEEAADWGGLALNVPAEGLDFNQAVDEFERRLIHQALERAGWIKNQAATLLGLNRTTLVEKIKKKGITPPPPPPKA